MISNENELRQERHILAMVFLCRLYEASIPSAFTFYKYIAPTALPKN
jgi:hypothetical protein